jgi:hypothetical protein
MWQRVEMFGNDSSKSKFDSEETESVNIRIYKAIILQFCVDVKLGL